MSGQKQDNLSLIKQRIYNAKDIPFCPAYTVKDNFDNFFKVVNSVQVKQDKSISTKLCICGEQLYTTESFIKSVCNEQVISTKKINYKNKTMPIRRIGKDTWVYLKGDKVGELIERKDKVNKSNNNIIRSMQKLRDIINTNCVDTNKLKWISLTYNKLQRDTKEVYKDFQSFIRKLRNLYNKHFEYIVALEPQQSGSFHLHLILISDKKMPYIDNNTVIAKLWGKGFANTQKLKRGSNIASYLCSYLTNEKTDKGIIKAGRLCFYPKNCQFFRCSRGIKKPEYLYIKHIDIKRFCIFQKEYTSSFILRDSQRIKTIKKFYKVKELTNFLQIIKNADCFRRIFYE